MSRMRRPGPRRTPVPEPVEGSIPEEARQGRLAGPRANTLIIALRRAAVALRIARRTTGRARARSALIVALVALPVAGMAAVTLVIPSTIATEAERLTVNLGQTQASVKVVSEPNPNLTQDPFTLSWGFNGESNPAPDAKRRDPGSLFPAAVRTIPVLETAVTVETATGVATVNATEGHTWDPALLGRYELTKGHAPQNSDEVLVTAATLDRLGVQLGQGAELVEPVQKAVTVVGLLVDRTEPASRQTLYGLPGTFTGDSAIGENPQTVIYLPDTKLSWQEVTDLNADGAIAFSRDVFANPPDLDTLSMRWHTGDSGGIAFMLAGMVLAFGLLEVMLLAGAAFTVGTRAQERSLATVASIGAERRTLFSIVTANGLVLGAIAGVIGVGTGIGIGTLFMRLTDNGSATRYWGFHLWWPVMVGIAVLAIGIGWLGALVPAARASKLDVVSALRGARRPTVPSKRRPIIGVFIVFAGVACTLIGGALAIVLAGQQLSIRNPLTMLASGLMIVGPILAQVGLIFCSGLLLRIFARLLSRAGVAARLASRDVARNPGRSVPALAVIMTTVFAAVFAMTMMTSAEATSRAAYQFAMMPDQVQLRLDYGDQRSDTYRIFEKPTEFESALASNLDAESVRTLKSVPDAESNSQLQSGQLVRLEDVSRPLPSLDIPPANQCPSEMSSLNFDEATTAPGSDAARKAAADWRCQSPYVLWGNGGISGHIWVGDADDLALVLAKQPSKAAQDALADGGAVSLYPEYVANGTVAISWQTAEQAQQSAQFGPTPSVRPVKTDTLPAVIEKPAHAVRFGIFVSPATAKKLDLIYGNAIVLASLASPSTDVQLDALQGSLDTVLGTTGAININVERGPENTATALSWGILALSALIAVGAAAVAIGLARADGRRDEATLAALGSSRRVRRGFGFWQAVVIAGIGSVLGAAVGLIPAVALTLPGADMIFSAPWPPIAATAVLMPLAIAYGSRLFAGRRKLELRRAAIE